MPRRILQVASALRRWGGTEKYVIDLSAGLQKHGHLVTIACPPDSEIDKQARAMSLRRIPLEIRHQYQWTRLPSFLKLMLQGFDVAHVHAVQDYIVPVVAAKLAGIPAVMTRHMPHPFGNQINAFICSRVLYKRIVAVSHFVQDVLITSGAARSSVEMIPNGLHAIRVSGDEGRELRLVLKIPTEAFVIGASGRIVQGKGFLVLLKAVSRLKVDGIACHCVIFGAGAQMDQLRAFAREANITDRVHLLGHRNDVGSLWSAADVAVVPSTEPEAFGFGLLEPLSAGIPVLASNVGALPEIAPYPCAMFVPAGDDLRLAECIRLLQSSPEVRMRMGSAGKLRASVFDCDHNVCRIERLYEGIYKGATSAVQVESRCAAPFRSE